MSRPESLWPELPYEAWQETCTTLHLWTQIVGKVRLAHTPWLNHGWHVPLYVTSRGLATSPIPYGSRSFEIVFDFNTHVLDIDVNDGSSRRLALRPRTVADFYEQLMRALSELDLATSISERPCEIADATPFGRDRIHSAYDAGYAHRFWRALVQVDRVLKLFRTGFIGKSSPVHFFWGSFDLAVTRFSGRSAPPFTTPVPGLAAAVMREAYSHEVSSAGFWPGNSALPWPAFYSYAYPLPTQFKEQPVQPQGASYNEALGEFVLPYEAVRTASDPEAALLSFLTSTYEAAAIRGSWDRSRLECALGRCGVPRES
ncbi:MAG TPA: DUF5996 family protein [Steroidobacteraceae bacterium]|nr:DUF5996 family protein [Steroidobacteraceae bacterium]